VKWSVAKWTNPRDGREAFGLFGSNKITPVMTLVSENEAHRWASIMNEGSQATSEAS
jgi:hypothetical protein